jgi:hypothetical protein
MRLHDSIAGPAFPLLAFRDAAPVVRYEIDAMDRLVRVNDAWSSFATANDGLHLVAHRIIGCSLWDFVAGETTRQVYKSLLRRVRDGGRSRFTYRCDAPERRRSMEMTITARLGGHVRFESRTLVVEYGPSPVVQLVAGGRVRPLCHGCRRPVAERLGPSGSFDPNETCPACVHGMLTSVAFDRPSERDPSGGRVAV